MNDMSKQDMINMKNMSKQVIDAMDSLSDEDAKKIDAMISQDSIVGSGIKERLIAMQEDFGEELFDKIVAGGSLMPVCDRWTGERAQIMVAEMIDSIFKFLHEKGFDKITRDHVSAFIEFGVNSMSR